MQADHMTTDISKKLTGFLTEYSNSLTRIEAEKSLMNGTLDSISEIQRIIDLAGETQ